MLSNQLFHYEYPEDGGGGAAPESTVGPAEEWRPSRDDWEAMQDNTAALREHVYSQQEAQQQYEQQVAAEQYQEQLEDLMFTDPEAYAQAVAQQAIETHVQPLAQEPERRQNEEAFLQAEDTVEDIYEELGVAEEERDEVRADANERLVQTAFEIVLGQQGYSLEQVNRAAQSPDPAARQWAGDVMRWADAGVGEMISGNAEAARIALSDAAANVGSEREAEAHIAAGGSVADLMFGGGPRGRAPSNDYSPGDSVSRRVFG